jgi:GNAT superfamily N-acetyltransferase
LVFVILRERMAESEQSFELISADLAPGDSKALDLDLREFHVARICASDHPLFDAAFERLWGEFGSHNTMESREIIAQRLGWHPATAIGNYRLRYEIIFVQRQNQFVAVRDHTAIVAIRRRSSPRTVVHLSHVFVDASWRRTGLAGWLRAWPIQTARACLGSAGLPLNSPITLVAEMEHRDLEFPDRMIRLKAYEKAGFKKIDPTHVNYLQPDFRPTVEIDASGGPNPLPFGLVARRVGREQEEVIRGAEVREIVECLYTMYGAGFRQQDMQPLWKTFQTYPADETEIPLVEPTQ